MSSVSPSSGESLPCSSFRCPMRLGENLLGGGMNALEPKIGLPDGVTKDDMGGTGWKAT